MLLAVTSTTLLAVSVTVGVVVAGGLVHVLVRLGRNEQRLGSVEEDVRDVRDDLRWWIRRESGGRAVAPSEHKERNGS